MATATQEELGGPGGESNPEELFAAALANCFTSTLTGMARARRSRWARSRRPSRPPSPGATGTHHHLSDATLHTRVASSAPEEQIRGLIAEAEAECPVCQAISGRVALHVTADVVTETA